jgi:hypothetical protein
MVESQETFIIALLHKAADLPFEVQPVPTFSVSFEISRGSRQDGKKEQKRARSAPCMKKKISIIEGRGSFEMKKIMHIILLAALLITLSACSGNTADSSSGEAASQSETWLIEEAATTVAANQATEATSNSTSGEYDADDLDASLDSSAMALIKLDGDAITLEGNGATVSGRTITITSAGIYSISGTLNDGQILVNSADEGKVRLILNGATISSSTSAPIYISNADKVVITLADGMDNYISDGAAYVFETADTNEPNAAIFSNDDLTINGNGSLTVNANYNNGIASDDDLKIISGSIMVKAVNDGIKGKNSIAIKDGIITVNAGSDGLQSNNAEDVEKGSITIDGGTLNIIAGLDGMQAETKIMINGGSITLSSGGGSINGISKADDWGDRGMQNDPNTTVEVDSKKGLKAGTAILISGGIIHIDSADDALNTNDSVTINGGEIALTSGDDGIHANTTLEINGGMLTITKSYEGIESSVITINGGNLRITASDDGINVAGGKDASALNGRPGQNDFTANANNYLYINDGYIYVDAGGDGLDSNGAMDMNGGTVIVNGPTNDGNGALDYMGTFTIDGGFLVAVGSSGMAMTPTTDSAQYSVLVNFTSMVSAGTMLHFETVEGDEVVTFVPAKEYQSILISTPAITNGTTLDLYYGGSSTGSLVDGLYRGGSYSGGTLITSLDISSVVTGLGSGGGMMPGGGGGGRQRP